MKLQKRENKVLFLKKCFANLKDFVIFASD